MLVEHDVHVVGNAALGNIVGWDGGASSCTITRTA